MDTMRAQASTSDTDRQMPKPAPRDERRMQVRAYNFWAGLLANRAFPTTADFSPEEREDFGRFGVMLDVGASRENPAIAFLGDKLAERSGISGTLRDLANIPGDSLLSHLTAPYMQVVTNQNPVSFEGEFTAEGGSAILYRAILLPFSQDDRTVDHIFGVVNWKELDAAAADARRNAAAARHNKSPAIPAMLREAVPMGGWADGPADEGFEEARFLTQSSAGDQIEERKQALRALPLRPLDSAEAAGEFAMLVVRRGTDGTLGLVGEIGEDSELLEFAAQRLLG